MFWLEKLSNACEGYFIFLLSVEQLLGSFHVKYSQFKSSILTLSLNKLQGSIPKFLNFVITIKEDYCLSTGQIDGWKNNLSLFCAVLTSITQEAYIKP